MPTGKETLESIGTALQREGIASAEITEKKIVVEVFPERGYVVSASDDGEEATISASLWHEHFDQAEQATACFMWLLTPFYRTVEIYKNEKYVRSYLERYDENGWEQIGMTTSTLRDVFSAFAKNGETKRIYQCDILNPKTFRERFPTVKLDSRGMPPDTVIGVREE